MKIGLKPPATHFTRSSGRQYSRPQRKHLPAAIANLYPLTRHPRDLPGHLVAEYFSPKCQDFMLAESALERDGLLQHFEFNPEILFYVPHPLRVEMRFGKTRLATVFDVASWDGIGPVTLWEIKADADMNTKRVATRQLPAQQAFCAEHGYLYRVLLESEIRAHPQALKNWSEILSYLARRRDVDLSGLENEIRMSVARAPLTIREVLRNYWDVPEEWVRTAIYRLLHAGLMRAPLDAQALTDDLLIGGAP